jgi:hypothetical protein
MTFAIVKGDIESDVLGVVTMAPKRVERTLSSALRPNKYLRDNVDTPNVGFWHGA